MCINFNDYQAPLFLSYVLKYIHRKDRWVLGKLNQNGFVSTISTISVLDGLREDMRRLKTVLNRILTVFTSTSIYSRGVELFLWRVYCLHAYKKSKEIPSRKYKREMWGLKKNSHA